MRACAASPASSTEFFGVVKSISASAFAISGSGSSPWPKVPTRSNPPSCSTALASTLLMRPERPAITVLMLMRSLRPHMLDEILHDRLPEPRHRKNERRCQYTHQRRLVEGPFV